MENPLAPRHGPANTQVEKVNEEETLVVDEMQDEQGIRHQADNDEEPSKCHSCCHKLIDFYFTYEFLILVVVVILLARAYPPLGAVYLAPQYTATWIAVIFIFVMAGLGLKTSEFHNAFKQIRFNLFVQCYNFGVVSAIVFGVSRLLESLSILDANLADGMVICASLPMTINMVLVLTKSAGGNEAAAVFNAAFGNMIGVFLSPVLILGYIGVTGQVDLASVFYKLGLRVVLPICVGQVLQKTSKRVVAFVAKYKKYFKKAQMYTLVFIIYTVFCETFASEIVSSVGNIFLMILFQFLCLCIVMVLAWILLRLFFREKPQLRVMGLFGCTHKTVAMGVPLINAIYDGNSNIGVYTLPLLIWHPMQLVIGSALAPRLENWVTRELEQLGSTCDNGGVEGQDGDESEYRSNGKEVKEDEPTDVEEGSPSNEQEATGSTSITTGNEGSQGK
jgi:sodium/bile acid cotransporter 7